MKKVPTTLLLILDGFGLPGPKDIDTVVNAKNMPHFFKWLKKFPNTPLEASGAAVGLFKGQEGNSEAGHLNLGAGRIVKQDALYISDAIQDGTFFKNNAFHEAIHHIKKYRTAAHVMGLLSNHNSAHSCPEHVYALLEHLHAQGVKKVYLHLFTDGRDSGQHDAMHHLKKLQQHFCGTEKIATIMGRLYGMDRNKLWKRTRAAYDAIVRGEALHHTTSAEEALAQGYNRGETDEYIFPTVITNTTGEPLATIKDNDAIFFFNLRSDRARQLTKALVQPEFEKSNPGAFHRRSMPKHIRFVAMTDFGPDLPGVLTAFPSRDIKNSLVQVLCPLTQLYIAESEKFAHITYFLNGGYAQHFCDEAWVKVASDAVMSYDSKPQMQARAIADKVIKAIRSGAYSFIAVNLANADMVGHTGNATAAKRAVQTLDTELNRIITALLEVNGQGILTADHGNIEELVNLKTGELDTEHSNNPVPCILFASPAQLNVWKIRQHRLKSRGAKLANVAPTLLKMMQIPKPKEMTAQPLF
jgi:2,3-bisphosphoglycerate-independent phosphoglycerate mutase